MSLTLGIYISFMLVCSIWMYLSLRSNLYYWKNLKIPHAEPHKFFSNMYELITFKRSLGEIICDIHTSVNSNYVGFFMFNQLSLLIRDPILVQKVLIKDFDHFDSRSVIESEYDPVASSMLFILHNPKWKRVRTKLTPAFTSGKIKRMHPLMAEVSRDLSGFINDKGLHPHGIDIQEMFLKFSTDVISSCAFGINTHSLRIENSEFREAGRRITGLGFARSFSMTSYFAAPVLAKLLRLRFIDTSALAFLHKVFWTHINERESSKSTRGDLIDILIHIRKSSDSDFDDTVVLAQAIQFFVAGFDTIGAGLTFILYCIAKHPDVQNRLRLEATETLKIHGGFTYQALKNMKYLEMTINETLRMYPPFSYLTRKCSKPYRLPESNVIVEEGVSIYVSLLGLHYDPQYYPDPHKFDPDRFSTENKAKRKSATYMPFGYGPRGCIGARFALMATKLALAAIVSEFEIETCPTTPEPLKLDPKGFLLTPLDKVLDLRFKKFAS